MATSIVLKDLPKKGDMETANLYIKGATVFYAVVHDVKQKYQSNEKEYSATVFVDPATKDELEDVVLVNKGFAEVGVSKTTKPPKRIKYPLSSQVEEGKVNYDAVKGMWGFSVARPEFSKKGNRLTVNVIDKDGNPFTENVGNGSVVNLKLFGYRNKDGQLVVALDTMQVIEHVPYEGATSSDSVVDDVLGVSYQVKKAETKPAEEAPKEQAKPQSKPAPAVDDMDDSSDLPF